MITSAMPLFDPIDALFSGTVGGYVSTTPLHASVLNIGGSTVIPHRRQHRRDAATIRNAPLVLRTIYSKAC